MPPRDPEEYESRRQQIIEGAFRVFSRKGFEQATNKEIAKEAGIGSPGLIYHYFSDKRALFQTVIESKSAALQMVVHNEAMLEEPPETLLPMLATTFLGLFESPELLPVFRLIFAEAMRRPFVAELVSQIGPHRFISFLTRYFERQVALGRMRAMDTSAAARSFVGPLIAYLLTTHVFEPTEKNALSPDRMISTHIDLFLRGIAPDEGNSR
ncbi:MAG: TetR/AcrR family transcriptional regulator [Anaerolineales bacterium]|nr:TetR/AcrR family transcriptional regulator [Anaerolineales bacterium]MCB9128897.1 TetR/AcrR family transcriptional regulator [Ardenticatenales bacterium]